MQAPLHGLQTRELLLYLIQPENLKHTFFYFEYQWGRKQGVNLREGYSIKSEKKKVFECS
jgi:hypothetical protein